MLTVLYAVDSKERDHPRFSDRPLRCYGLGIVGLDFITDRFETETTILLSQGQRKLAAIMFTDMVGYTALGQKDESLSLALVEEQRKLIRPILSRHGGKEVKTIGDAFLVEFPNAVDAVRCAYDIQRAIRDFNLAFTSDRRIHLRIGVHVGEVVESQEDISGDAVNVASRIEPFAEDGGVCITRQVYDHVRRKVDLPLLSLGSKSLKNVAEPTEIFKMVMPWETAKEIIPTRLDARRIAVLPFANMSPDPADSYFADGITEEIISTVSSISGLSVISRTSVMGYKGTTKKVGEIATELKVGSVLEGSFRKVGNRTRITAQLIDANDDSHVWAQNYDRELDDVFAVQADIAKRVAEALRVKILSPEMTRLERSPTQSKNALSLYLRGRYHWYKRDIHEVEKAVDCFEKAIKEDSNFALGYVGLADCFEIISANFKIDGIKNHEKAKMMLGRALELDPDLAEAHATQGLVLSNDFKLHEAEEEFRKAIELKPSYSSAHQWYAFVLSSLRRWDEAREQIEKAVELDPFSSVINVNHSFYYMSKHDYTKALEIMKRTVELDPSSAFPHLALARNYGRLKMIDDAKRELKIFERLSKDVYPNAEKIAEAELMYAKGDKAAMKRLLPEIEALAGALFFMRATDIAGFHFWVGETDKGFAWLERSYSERDTRLTGVREDERFGSVLADPRFLGILKRIGLE